MNTQSRYLVIATLALAVIGGCSKAKEQASAIPSDAQLAIQVQQRIANDTALSGTAITVNANNGVVTLTGQVHSQAELKVALADVQGAEGVKQVVSLLQVGGTENTALAEAAPPAAPAPAPPVRSYVPAAPRTRALPHAAKPTAMQQPAFNAPSYAPPVAAPAPVFPTTSSADVAPVADRVVERPLQPVTVPAGTTLQVRLADSLSSETSRVNEPFRGTLNSEVMVNDQTVIPAGADVEGQVVAVQGSAHYAGQSLLALQLTRIHYNGATYNVVTDQWERKGEGRGKSTATKVGTGAAIGAVLGGIFGGGKGAAIGATAGAGAGAGANTITKGKPVELGPESLVSFRLEAPFSATPSPNTGRIDNNSTSDSQGDRPVLHHGPVLKRD